MEEIEVDNIPRQNCEPVLAGGRKDQCVIQNATTLRFRYSLQASQSACKDAGITPYLTIGRDRPMLWHSINCLCILGDYRSSVAVGRIQQSARRHQLIFSNSGMPSIYGS